jgi:hypothetical protein
MAATRKKDHRILSQRTIAPPWIGIPSLTLKRRLIGTKRKFSRDDRVFERGIVTQKEKPPLRLDVLSLTSISHRVLNPAGDSHRVRTDGSSAVKHHWDC